MVFSFFQVSFFQLKLHTVFEPNVFLILKPYTNWKNIHDDLSSHDTLQYHQTSMIRLLEYKNTYYNPNTELIIRLGRKSKDESLNFNIYYKIN